MASDYKCMPTNAQLISHSLYCIQTDPQLGFPQSTGKKGYSSIHSVYSLVEIHRKNTMIGVGHLYIYKSNLIQMHIWIQARALREKRNET